MAFVNRLDPEVAGSLLAPWMSRHLPGSPLVTVTDATSPSGSGLSSETVLFTAAWEEGGRERSERLVARIAPAGEVLHLRYDLPSEFAVMQALGAHTDVPVPSVRWLETDASVLGSDFFVMAQADGAVPPDDPPFPTGSWVTELPETDQARLYDNGLRTLAAIHQVDWSKLGLTFLADPDRGMNGLHQQIDYFERFFHNGSDGTPNPTLEAAFEWVKANLPAETGPAVISWGDARIGNMVFGGDLQVTAVLDWELAGVGQPELDLGYWLFMDRHHSEGVGAPRVPGFPSRDAAVARYEELTGHVVEDLHYYEVFAGVRTAVQMVRIAGLLTGAGVLPPGNAMAQSNPGTHLLARLLELPAPRGQVQSAI